MEKVRSKKSDEYFYLDDKIKDDIPRREEHF